MLASKKILVISDNVTLYKMLCGVLAKEGYQIPYVQITDPQLRLTINEILPDLIIIDPDKSPLKGVELSILIRRWSPAPILLLTTVGSGPHEVRALNLESDDYLSEPFDISLVATRINNILSLSPTG